MSQHFESDLLKARVKSVDTLSHLVKEKNSHLSKNNKKTRLCLRVIDAADMAGLLTLSKQFDWIFLITEQIGLSLPPNVVLCALPDEFHGSQYIPTGYWPTTDIVRDYNCFLNRLDAIRQSWFYLLYDRQLLDRGNVSFLLTLKEGCSYPADTPKKVFDLYHDQFLSSFDYIKPRLDELVPFKNFVTENLLEATQQTKFSVVVETYFERVDAQVLSEKTFRALQSDRPCMLFAATGCVGRLRAMGFDLFDDIIDHAYNDLDTSVNASPVIDIMIDQMKDLIDLDITPALLDRFRSGAAHNRKILHAWNDNFYTQCSAVIEQAYEQANG